MRNSILSDHVSAGCLSSWTEDLLACHGSGTTACLFTGLASHL